jgi:UDP-N-acetylmuramoyl-L-alanyl-D-glutamate--2,6-diaminopimelate ligase
MVMLQNTAASKYSYALRSPADYKTRIIENNLDGLVLDLDGSQMHARMIGEFNAANLTAAYWGSPVAPVWTKWRP